MPKAIVTQSGSWSVKSRLLQGGRANDQRSTRLSLRVAEGSGQARQPVHGQGVSQAGTHPGIIQVWDYLVELPGTDGQPKRLTIRVRGFGFNLPAPGNMVPVVLNRRRTKAAFDVDDPSISLSAQYGRDAQKRKEKAAADKAEFEAKRAGKN